MIIRGSVGMFISPEGEILLNKGSHIQAVISDPEKFGLTLAEIRAEYLKYGEPVGMEGKAREVLLKRVIGKGWLRLRRYTNRKWSITVYQLNKHTENRIEVWHKAILEGVCGIQEADPYLPVVVTELQAVQETEDVD